MAEAFEGPKRSEFEAALDPAHRFDGSILARAGDCHRFVIPGTPDVEFELTIDPAARNIAQITGSRVGGFIVVAVCLINVIVSVWYVNVEQRTLMSIDWGYQLFDCKSELRLL